MIFKNTILTSVVLTFFQAATAFADCSGEVCTNVRVESLFTPVSGYASVTTTGDESDLNCGLLALERVRDSTLSYGLRLSMDSENTRELHSTLLAAMLSDRPITITVTGSSVCYISAVGMTRG